MIQCERLLSLRDMLRSRHRPNVRLVESQRCGCCLELRQSHPAAVIGDMSVDLQSRSRGSPLRVVSYFQCLMDGRHATGIAMDYCEVVSHSFHVASEKVRVGSKSKDDAQYTWDSVAGRSFTVRKDTEMVYRAAKRGVKIPRSWREHLPESVEERRLKDRAKKHSEFIGFSIELYVEKLKPMTLFREITQQSKTLRVIQRDTSQRHKITQFYAAAIRTLVRSGTERVKKYDHSFLRVVGTAINPEAWCWYYGVVREKRCVKNQLDFTAWLFIPRRAPFLRYFPWWIPW